MRNKETNKNQDSSFGFGLGITIIVAGILTFNFYTNLMIRIIVAFMTFIGFAGVGFEFDKLKLRMPYKLAFGFYFLIASFWCQEYFNWLFILAISISTGIFVSTLAEYLLQRFTNKKLKDKAVSSKITINSIEGVLSIVGSFCSLLSSVVALFNT